MHVDRSMMAKNLSIRFSAASSAAAITTTPSTPVTDQPVINTTSVGAITDDSSGTLRPGDAGLDCYNQIDDELTFCDASQTLNGHEPVAFVDDSALVAIVKNKKNSPTVGAKVDRFVRQLQESLNPSSVASSNTSTKQPEALVTSWCKFAKTEDSLEIISGNQAESDDSHRERVSITLTPASVPNQNVCNKPSSLTTSTSSTSWLNEMKLFRDKFRNEKKGTEDANGNGSSDVARKMSGGQLGKLTGTVGTPTASPTASQVTVSNAYLNNNYFANNNYGGHTCSSCLSRRNQNNLQTQSSAQSAPFYCSCSRDTDQTKCPTPQRTPTPPLFMSPREVVFDPNLDPYLVTESPMLFSFKSDGKEKKEKKEKEVKKNKLFTGSSSSQSKDKGKESSVRKKSKEVKERDKEKESNNLMKNISTRSSSVTSSNSMLSPSANNNSSTSLSSFLSIISSSSSNKNTSPTQSRYSSTENISASTDSAQTTVNGSSAKNIPKKEAKMSSSRSMISFRKLMKNENDEAVLEDELSHITMHIANDANQSNAVQGNPTLRRKPDSFRKDNRRGSPTMDSNFNNDDGFSVSSKSSASSLNLESDHSLSQLDLNQTTQPSRPLRESVLHSLHSGVFSWAMCFSYAYYVFALIVALFCLLISLISPLPGFLNGFVLGFTCTFLLITVVIVYAFSNYVFVKSPEAQPRSLTPDSVSLKRNKKKLSINNVGNQIESDSFSGWVYEFIGDYDEREKNGFVSQLVYINLRGSKLIILTPSQEVNEKTLKKIMAENKMPTFSSQRVIDFSKQSHKRITLLLTKNVRNQRKYVWSKKYPICLAFNDDRPTNGGGYLVVGKHDFPEPVSRENERAKIPPGSPIEQKFVIFARTCRDKEEWFWAIKNVIDAKNSEGSPKSSALSLSDSLINETFVETTLEASETFTDFTSAFGQQYLRILTRRFNYSTFMRANVLNIEGVGPNSTGMMTPLTWFNVLLNRLSFDLLNKPNWSAYIAKKLQRKLRKLRLPYFMESLTITEIDIGTTLPKFNSVPNVPVVDDAGLWIDFDVNYSGKDLSLAF